MFGGVLDGAVHIELGGGQVHQAGVLPQAAQGHLELPVVQSAVLAEIPIAPLPGHPEGPALPGLPAHTQARRGHAQIAEDRHAVGAHPVAAAVVLFPLLVSALPEQGLNLQLGQAFVQLRLLLVVLPQGGVGPVQPPEQLLGNLFFGGDALKIVQKTPVEGVKVRLALHQQTPAQVVKAGEAGPV